MTIRNFHLGGEYVGAGHMRHFTRTIDLDRPTKLRAFASLGQVMCGPGGYVKVGIFSCRFRNEFNEEEANHFGSFWQWPLFVHRPRMTSVTFILRLDGRRNGSLDAVVAEAVLTLIEED
jgi:hypothetical protein